VAGYRAWQALGRQVRRGERGITILAPVTYRTTVDADDDTEERAGLQRLVGFKPATIFDISQTDREPIPNIRPALLEGEAPARLWEGLAFQIEGEGYTLRRGRCHDTSDPTTRLVTVRADLQPAHAAGPPRMSSPTSVSGMSRMFPATTHAAAGARSRRNPRRSSFAPRRGWTASRTPPRRPG
jgi:hypothetical protein